MSDCKLASSLTLAGFLQNKKPKTSHREPSASLDVDQAQIPAPQAAAQPSAPGLSNLASTQEVAFFERVKKAIDDRTTYHEFLKLLNLFVNDLIDSRVLVDRAMLFLGGEESDLFNDFKVLVGYEAPPIVNNSYPSSGIINPDPLGSVENVPMLQRPRVDLGVQKAQGPSYRKLPKSVGASTRHFAGYP